MRASLLFALLLSGCFGCEAQTKTDDRRVVGAWMMAVGEQDTLVVATEPAEKIQAQVTVIRYETRRAP